MKRATNTDLSTWSIKGGYDTGKRLAHSCPPSEDVPYQCFVHSDGNLYCGWCRNQAPKEMQQVALLCGCTHLNRGWDE